MLPERTRTHRGRVPTLPGLILERVWGLLGPLGRLLVISWALLSASWALPWNSPPLKAGKGGATCSAVIGFFKQSSATRNVRPSDICAIRNVSVLPSLRNSFMHQCVHRRGIEVYRFTRKAIRLQISVCEITCTNLRLLGTNLRIRMFCCYYSREAPTLSHTTIYHQEQLQRTRLRKFSSIYQILA